MTKKISEERQMAYYLGMVLIVIGFLLFVSVFFSVTSSSGGLNGGSFAFRAFVGMGLIFLGNIIRSIAAKGLAGSGVILDPEKARDELEPYSRMAGGMVKDALDEADINLHGGNSESEKIIMVKCRECGKLNEEDSKFCQECGKPL